MNLTRLKILTGIIFTILLFFSTSCLNKRTGAGLIIISRTTSSLEDPDFIIGESWRYMPNSSIIAVERSKPDKKPLLLTVDFFAACSPSISYDGKKMLFAGQQEAEDPWQIWEMNLEKRRYNKVTDFIDNCTDPVYLPNNRIIFSRKIHNDTTGSVHQIYSCNHDGSDIRQVTFHPHADFASAVLADGRILTVTRQIFPDIKEQFLMVLRPDGTKADRFYNGPAEGEIISSICETPDGKVFFVENKKGSSVCGDIKSISLNRPLHSKKNITGAITGSYYSVNRLSQTSLLVSFRPEGTMEYSLYEFDLNENKTGELLYSEQGYNVTSAVMAEAHPRPKKLPSEVDILVKTGQILCQDINFTGPEIARNFKSGQPVKRIEVLGLNSSLGIVDPEEDGSIYLKPLADMPFRIQTIDESGKITDGPSGWLWLRPNERRGCIGCHEDPELAPENRLAMAVKKPPVNIPLHIQNIKEKSVELE